MEGKKKKWMAAALVAAVLLGTVGAAGFRLAGRILEDKVAAALGPRSEIGSMRLGLTGVEAGQVSIRGNPQWPAGYEFRAGHIKVVPSLRSLLSGEYRVRSITVVRPYLSVLRTGEGRLRILPGLLETGQTGGPCDAPATQDDAAPAVSIGRIVLQDGVVELFDATAAKNPPLKIRMEGIRAEVREITIPSFADTTRFELAGVVKGASNDGHVRLAGWTELASKDTSLSLKLESVDMTTIQPYLIGADEAEIIGGTLDLDLTCGVEGNYLKAPGAVRISGLELASPRTPWGTFMGAPRSAVLKLLKSSDNAITLDFTLEGDLSSPRFSFNDALSRRLAASMTDLIQGSLGRAVEGAGAIGTMGRDTAGEMIKGLNSAVQDLFGRGEANRP